MTDLAAIKERLRERIEALRDGTGTIARDESGRAYDPAVVMRNAVLALLADTPSVEPGGAELARLRQAAATDWHDSTRIKVTAGDLRAVLALLPTQASDSPEKPT